jgi:hypothetical protein
MPMNVLYRNTDPFESIYYRGFFTQCGRCWPVVAEFDVIGDRMRGISWDDVGPAILDGRILANRWILMTKSYGRYSVLLIGQRRSKGIISGRWWIGLFQTGIFEFWPDEDAEPALREYREQALKPKVSYLGTKWIFLPANEELFNNMAGDGAVLYEH